MSIHVIRDLLKQRPADAVALLAPGRPPLTYGALLAQIDDTARPCCRVPASRPTELDALLGSVIELGRIVGVVTPTLDVVYALTSARCRISALSPRA